MSSVSGSIDSSSSTQNSVAVDSCIATLIASLGINNCDVFIHSWKNWFSRGLPRPLKLIDHCVEDNQSTMTYAQHFLNGKSYFDPDSKGVHDPIFSSEAQGFLNQISAAISRAKVLRMAEKNSEKYDFYILVRPDLIFFNKIDVPAISAGQILVNKSPTTVFGDFIYLVDRQAVDLFYQYADISVSHSSLIYLPHYGFPSFCWEKCSCLDFVSCTAGIDVEVYRKSFIPVLSASAAEFPCFLEDDQIKYLMSLALKHYAQTGSINWTHESNYLYQNICDSKESVINFLEFAVSHYTPANAAKLTSVYSLLHQYKYSELLEILPFFALAEIIYELPHSAALSFCQNHIDDIFLAADSNKMLRPLLMLIVWDNHFKYSKNQNNLFEFDAVTRLRDRFYRARDLNCFRISELLLASHKHPGLRRISEPRVNS